MEIKIITSSDMLWEQVITYAENCSWRAGKFLAGQMRHGGFHGWERVLIAVENGKIAGYCTVCEKDVIPDLPYTPFICSLFVGEPYRGARLSQRIIEAVMAYIRTLGFDAAYLFSDHIGLYEKYGFVEIGKYPAPWGEMQKIYRRTVQDTPPNPLMLRLMEQADVPYLKELLTLPEIKESLHWSPTTAEIEEAYETFWSKDPDEAHYIIVTQDKPIGWLKLNGLLEHQTLWISMLVLHPLEQNKGYGRKVLVQVEKMATNRGFRSVGIQTTADNAVAIALYRKCGYQMTCGDSPNYIFTKELL